MQTISFEPGKDLECVPDYESAYNVSQELKQGQPKSRAHRRRPSYSSTVKLTDINKLKESRQVSLP